MSDERNAYKILVAKPEGKIQIERHRSRWEDVIIHLNEMGLESVDWIDLAEDGDQWWAVVNIVMNLRVP
jgi:hypothetical protein